VRPPGRATCTSLRQECIAFGGAQRIAAQNLIIGARGPPAHSFRGRAT
jgi:hypothetical protein